MNHPTPLKTALGVILALLAFSGCTATQPSPTAPAPAASATTVAASPATPFPTTSGQPRTNRAAAAAFRTWVAQFNAEDWDKHYATLVSAQRKLISAKKYAACRNKKASPTFKWIKTASTKANVKTKIPGTSLKMRATRVIARLRMYGTVTVPVTAHMFYEEGEWRWSMTKENLAGCKR